MIEISEELTREMNKYLDGTTIEEIITKNRKMFRFQMMLTPEHLEQRIDSMDFSVRAHHCLKRAGINTVGELVEHCYAKPEATSKKQLQQYRNLGKTSADEILIKLFCYQFSILPDYRKSAYMKWIAEVNQL